MISVMISVIYVFRPISAVGRVVDVMGDFVTILNSWCHEGMKVGSFFVPRL